MTPKYKIKKRIFISVVILIFSFCFFIVSIPSFANDENIDKTLGGQVDNNTDCNTEYLKLLEAVKIKADVANEKENAYNQAVNHIKWWLSGLGCIVIIIVTILGIWRNNTLESARKKMESRTEKEIERIGKTAEITLKNLKDAFDAEKSEEIKKLKSVIYKANKYYEDINREKISKLEDQLFQILLNKGEKGEYTDDCEDIESPNENRNRKSIKDKNEDPFA